MTSRARGAKRLPPTHTPAVRRACTTARSAASAAAFFMKSTTTRPPAMLKTGSEHLESLRDGRIVYIGSERVEDVTTHPGFRNGARSMAAIYDLKRADPAFSFEENGERFSAYFLRARTREDLGKRTAIHKAIARMSHGLP